LLLIFASCIPVQRQGSELNRTGSGKGSDVRNEISIYVFIGTVDYLNDLQLHKKVCVPWT